MTRLYLSLFVVLGLSFNCLAQDGPGPTQDQCNEAVQAYQSQRATCADQQQQLNDLRMRMTAFENERAALLKKCKEDRDPLACKALSELGPDRLSIMQQEYNDQAQRGCTVAPLPPECSYRAVQNQKSNRQDEKALAPAHTLKDGKGLAPAHGLKTEKTPSTPTAEGNRQIAPPTPRVQPHGSEVHASPPPPSVHPSGNDRIMGNAGGVGAGSGSTAGNSAPAPRPTGSAAAGAATPK